VTTSTAPKIILVTGAGGLIGSAICRGLIGKGLKVRALLATQEPVVNIEGLKELEVVRGDVRNAPLMMNLARDCQAVIHSAALNTLYHRPSRDFYHINVDGTANILRAAATAGVKRFVYTSSCEVMGPAKPQGPADESRPISSKGLGGHYERSKYQAEDIVRKGARDGLPCIILRPTAVLGPGDIHGTPPGRLLRAFLRCQIPAYYDAGINVVDSRDAAWAHILALTEGRIGQAYIVGAHNIWLSTLFGMLERETGVPAPVRRIGYHIAKFAAALNLAKSFVTGADPGFTPSNIRTIKYPWFFDTTKARRELGLEPRPLAETVGEAVKWHMKNMGSRMYEV
jgi:dihydroflavonol-4-reductase